MRKTWKYQRISCHHCPRTLGEWHKVSSTWKSTDMCDHGLLRISSGWSRSAGGWCVDFPRAHTVLAAMKAGVFWTTKNTVAGDAVHSEDQGDRTRRDACPNSTGLRARNKLYSVALLWSPEIQNKFTRSQGRCGAVTLCDDLALANQCPSSHWSDSCRCAKPAAPVCHSHMPWRHKKGKNVNSIKPMTLNQNFRLCQLIHYGNRCIKKKKKAFTVPLLTTGIEFFLIIAKWNVQMFTKQTAEKADYCWPSQYREHLLEREKKEMFALPLFTDSAFIFYNEAHRCTGLTRQAQKGLGSSLKIFLFFFFSFRLFAFKGRQSESVASIQPCLTLQLPPLNNI